MAGSAIANAGEEAFARTTLTTFVGTRPGDQGGSSSVSVFKGIPYAEPPVGARRWKPPETLAVQEEETPAKVFAPACMQPAVPKTDFFYNPIPLMSEDCLYLNVWTAADLAVEEARPVMVWIHGGALLNGSGSDSGYDGSALARKGVVVVTINYRLHVFGYFSHPELNSESRHNASGNYGTMDQVQALRWIQQHIRAFGGDPDRVTIFGESAGALSVSHLMATPLAKGLFHRAIMQSGYLPPSLVMTRGRFGKDAAGDTGKQLEEATGVAGLAGLRNLSARALLKSAQANGFYPETVIDGHVFPMDINEAFEAGKQADVPLLAGFNSGEAYPFALVGLVPDLPPDSASYEAEVRRRYGEMANKYLSVYPPNDIRESVFGASRDGFFGWATEYFVRAMANVDSPAYLYYFDYVTDSAAASGMGAFHSAEIPFVFDNLGGHASYPPQWPALPEDPGSLAVAGMMSDYWVAFATHGKPLVRGLPKWSPYTGTKRHFMRFKKGDVGPDVDLLPGMFELHQRIVNARRKEERVAWWFGEIGLFAPH